MVVRDEEGVQQGGELGDDPVGVVAEEGDDLGDEARRAPVFLQHLQLLELLVHQTLHGNHDIYKKTKITKSFINPINNQHGNTERERPDSPRRTWRRGGR